MGARIVMARPLAAPAPCVQKLCGPMLRPMSRGTINLICAELPGTEKSDAQDGAQDVWTVGGEEFARLGGEAPGISVMCADTATAEMLIAGGVAHAAPGLRAPWVSLPLESPEAELRQRIVESYEVAREGLPKSILATLDRTSG